eukprot:scaffold9389_cov63-Attheya_sp.AAC.3
MIIGQLAGGTLGDAIGRHKAMTLVMFSQILQHAVWSFILGLGCRGVYPLAATLTVESLSKQENSAKLVVALTFSMQGIGGAV